MLPRLSTWWADPWERSEGLGNLTSTKAFDANPDISEYTLDKVRHAWRLGVG